MGRMLHVNSRSIAVVGGGFGGVGAAVMLRRAGYDDVTVFERGERRRRRLAPQHLSRRRLRRPVAPLRVLVRAEPALVAPLRAAGRDPGLPRGRRAAPRRARPHPHEHRGRRARAGTSERGKWVLETSAGHARGRRPAHRLRPALGPVGPADPRPRQLRGPGVPHRASGATTSTWPASAWRWSAPAAARSRSCPRSSRSSSSVDVYQRSPGWTIPKMDFAYKERTQAPVRALPGAPAPRPRGDLRLHGARRRGDDPPAAGCSRRSAPSARRQINEGDQGPGAAAQGDPDRRDRLQADHAHRRVVSDADQAERRAGHRPDRRGHAGRDPHRGRHRARRPTCSCSATGFKTPRLRRADGDRRRGRPHAGRGVGATCPRAYLGHERARASRTCSCSTGRTRTAARAR